jgi:molybdopterin-guanine dinucleotide biosynthesis protein A
MRFAGIVVAGGAARRLSGVDKPQLRIGGKPLLARAISALAGAEQVIAVGPRRAGFDVVWTREREPGSGPVAALAAGLEFVPAGVDVAAVLAADLPGIRRSTVDRLLAALGGADGAVLVDASGARQWLVGVWRVEALRAALPDPVEHAALRRMLDGLDVVEVPAEPGEADDIDTPEDLETHR